MKNLTIAFLLSFAVLLAAPALSQAADTQFEFYYQRIDEVVEINNPAPQGWWQHTKAAVKGAWNWTKRSWDYCIGRNFTPGEGQKNWYSSKDHNKAYKVTRAKVRDEAHLLELMGAKGDPTKLTDGQKAILATFRHSRSQAVQARMPYSWRSNVKVILTDATGFEDESKYPNVIGDFWPYSSGFMISMNSKMYNHPNGAKDMCSTFVHEFAHSMDMTIMELSAYGPDGSHMAMEKTAPRAAFLEGFAEFNEMLDSPDGANGMREAVKTIAIEDAKKAGEYKWVSAASPELSGTDLLNVEGINAMILYRLVAELPGGRDKVFHAFTASRYPWRSLKHLLRSFVKSNPGDLAKVAAILDGETYKKLTDAEMRSFLGRSPALDAYLQTRGKTTPVVAAAPLVNPPVDQPAVMTVAAAPVTVGAPSRNPFAEDGE